MRISLYEHQRSAVKRMKNGCILVGGVGSGKSRTSLAYYYISQGGSLDSDELDELSMKDLYIITTARKRDTLEWDAELTPFLLSTNQELNQFGNKVVIDSWNNIHKYVGVENAFFIFDEQRVVGSGTWVKSFIAISKKNEWILLSATPGDTWRDYAPVFVANGYYKNITDFCRQHVVYSRFAKYPKVDHYVGVQKLSRLRNDILVKMAFNRPTIPHHVTIPVGYDKELYSKVVKERWDVYKDEPCQDAAALCRVLRKIVNSDVTRVWSLEDLMEKHSRLIIFYNFNYELDILREIARKTKTTVGEWNGRRHDPVPSGERWLYLVQYSAGSEGWNCVETNATVFFSQNYSYKMMTQAAGRIDRLNTKYRDLYFYHMRSSSSIDKAIHDCLTKKGTFNEDAFVKAQGGDYIGTEEQ